MSMNQEIKAQWLAALRSGDYKQGQQRLVTILADGTEEFCCLGVLCDLALKSGLELEVTNGNVPGESYNFRSYNSVASVLPVAVVKWAGLEDNTDLHSYSGLDAAELNVSFQMPCSCGCCETGEISETLSSLNDSGQPFTEIADKIEQYL